MNTTFNIIKDDKCREYILGQDKTIFNLKELIINDFSLNKGYIDINFILERPIRSLGKFNLESGDLPRTLDMYPLSRFDLEGRSIKATFSEVDNYTPYKKNKNKNDIKLSVLQNNLREEQNTGDVPFNIKSLDDIPLLS